MGIGHHQKKQKTLHSNKLKEIEQNSKLLLKGWDIHFKYRYQPKIFLYSLWLNQFLAGPARGGLRGYIVPGPGPRGGLGSRGPEDFRFPR